MRLPSCCSDGFPSVNFSDLPQDLSKEPSPWGASSRKSPGCSKPLPLMNYGGHCALGNLQFNAPEFFHSLPQIWASTQSNLWALQAVPLTSWLHFFPDLHHQLWDTGMCLFQITSNQLNLPQEDSNHGVETFKRCSRVIGSTIFQGLNIYVNMIFQIFHHIIYIIFFFQILSVES